ncbi:4414_t:CDS:2 [Funneliformis caledonium]|uniref:4414_t:CDS:1 n=1 Tax=Funneliformis caledonium TaxID=1117310 RepID=A0A9N9FHX0_9GLOM|nr:4414_t:CDS:2 [Funneliformis caledonium]
MDEKADKRVHRTFQESKTGEPNICSVWCRGEDGFRVNGASRPEKVSFQNANCLGRQNHNNEYGKFASPISSKCNHFSGKGEDRKIYVRGVSPHVTKDQQFSSTVEGYNPIVATFLWATAPNRYLGGPCMDERRTEDTDEEDEPREGCNNPKSPLMIVEMIANKSDRKRVANSLNCKLEGGDLSNCICYMEQVKEYYGFDHIIIIGELHAGILFFWTAMVVCSYGTQCVMFYGRLGIIGTRQQRLAKQSGV